MGFNKTFGLMLFLASSVAGIGSSYAGFGATYLGQKTEAQQSEESLKGMAAARHSSAPALQIYDDRYVPDVVRKKYGLSDDWYGKGEAFQKVEPLPISKPVDDMSGMSVPAKGKESVAPADSLMLYPKTLAPEDKTPAAPVVAAPIAAPELSAKVSALAVESWRARKGENLRDILKRWSERGHANLMWASSEVPVLEKDFSFFGKYQDAVNALIKSSGGANIHSQYRSEGFDPMPLTPAATVTTNSPPAAAAPEPEQNVNDKKSYSLMEAFKPAPKEDRRAETRWFGLSGAPLAEVIRVWCDDAGVKLIWQSERNFALKESVSQIGQFEDVVYLALSQYDNEDVRPVGEIYHDPRTGERVLLVRTDVK